MKKYLLVMLATVHLVGCGEHDSDKKITVSNNQSFARSGEVVSISAESVGLHDGQVLTDFGIANDKGVLELIQYVDDNKDGIADRVLFQPSVPANAKAVYTLLKLNEDDTLPTSENECYSRFVPERTDDYAWENDKVAFRTYGPTAQQMVEDSVKGGTLTSGMDCWLKRVEYPVINKWYKKYTEKTGSYHRDTGEGLDNFHVGASRGCGGIAIKNGDEYKTSKNFTAYETLATGPMSTSFVLDYAPWEIAEGKNVKTSKLISLDKGSHLSRVEVSVAGSDVISAGLTLHQNDGEVKVDSLGGWITYWQPHGRNSRLATAIVASPGTFLGYEKVVTDVKDLSNVYAHLSVNDGKAIYYTGFFWEKSNHFDSVEQWYDYLSQYAQQLANPLTVAVD
ncbi:DUF4861 domain-containing protein [Reichenbachiella carrageenanivorans]|uniref:DUF4861 domain-containing protein n=1 Tax=Reichenbachiella carrageenanivorans TaxID=2979869 RepID=A0ABY6CZS8_9BACT|nr:DUF4861 domain-containing protein [Reichenbachiella carrageenanivorans]UXX79392.1 DUF4861 domain-containing protein [Reichenbachiella carrageenanivorans]